MEIKGKVHCFFEQSGTFKNEFKKLGYEAYDYDIQNNFNETDYVIDLFQEIDNAYENKPSIFDSTTQDDLILAFYPCIYFCETNACAFTLWHINYKYYSNDDKIKTILERSNNRQEFYNRLIKFVGVCLRKKLRLIFENPYNKLSFLDNNFLNKPSVIDKNRQLRGDYFRKPTGYWFFNCEPTYGESYQQSNKKLSIRHLPKNPTAGQCSEERSMISPDYARNWICDFVLGKTQQLQQQKLIFESEEM